LNSYLRNIPEPWSAWPYSAMIAEPLTNSQILAEFFNQSRSETVLAKDRAFIDKTWRNSKPFQICRHCSLSREKNINIFVDRFYLIRWGKTYVIALDHKREGEKPDLATSIVQRCNFCTEL